MRETWLIRHGQSIANAGQPTESPAASRLSDLGRVQAGLLADSLHQQPDLIVTSPYIRTGQTAAPLRDRYPDCPHEKWPVQEFNYLNRSWYAGKTSAERKPAIRAYWEHLDPNSIDGPGAESFVAFMERVQRFAERAATRDGLTMVFTHGKFIRGCVWQLFAGPGNLGIDAQETMTRFGHWRLSFRLPNTGIIKIRWGGDAPCLSGVCRGHLDADTYTF